MRYQAQRGTYDVTPDNAYRWQHVETTFQSIVERFGYGEIRTPTFEDTDLFVRSSGDTSEVVTKQMYTFVDKGDRSLTLKPEGTAPAIRAYLEHNLGQTGGVTRLWYKTPIFRYERPQKGRCREAHQVGLELIGSPSAAADAEVIEITVQFYRELGVSEPTVLLNCIGRDATREAYRNVVLEAASGILTDMDSDVRARAERNPLRLLDSKDPAIRDALGAVPPITNFLEDSSKAHFEEVQALLTEAAVPFTLCSDIVRGLDYYTDTVFEVQSSALGAQSSLCGGGRYDNLVKELGGAATPSVGVAMGIERAVIVLEESELPSPKRSVEVFIVCAAPAAENSVRALARQLRQFGISVITDIDGKAMRAQVKAADRVGAIHTLFIGDDELASDTVTIRNMGTGEQRTVPRNRVAGELRH